MALVGLLSLSTGAWVSGGENVWTKVGAFGGDVGALIAASDGTLYAGTMRHGVYRSGDGAGSWAYAGIDGTWVQALAVDPLRPDLIYAGTDRSLWRTLDGGVSWQDLGAGFWPVAGSSNVQALAIAPSGRPSLFAGTLDSLYRSDDLGDTWVKTGTGAPEGTAVTAIAFRSTDPNTLYIGTGNGVYRSPDRGGSWVWASGGIPVSDRRVSSLAFLATNPPKIFVTKTEGLLASSDDGERWSLINTGVDLSQRWPIVAADPRHPGVLYVGYSTGALRSDDGGATWRDAGAGLPTVALSAFAFPSDRQGVVLVGSRGGGTVRSEAGAAWTPAYHGLPSTTIAAVTVAETTPVTVYAATDGAGLFASRDGGVNWGQVGVELSRTDVLSVVVDPRDPSRIVAGSRQGVFLSIDGGASWQERLNAGSHLRVENIAIDPVDRNRIAVVSQHSYWLDRHDGQRIGGLFLTENGGATWREGFRWGPWFGVPALAFDHQGALLVAGSFGVYRLTDSDFAAGQNLGLWQPLDAMALDPRSESTMYVGGDYGVFKTDDGGSTWREVGPGATHMPWYVQALAVDPSSPEKLYIGTRRGAVFRSTDSAATWVPASFGLPLDEITSVTVGADGQVYVGTRSSGLFAARFPDEPARPVRRHLRPGAAPISAWPDRQAARRPS